MKYLGIDIGGTWIKGMVSEAGATPFNDPALHKILRVESPLQEATADVGVAEAIQLLLNKLGVKAGELAGVGIATAGIVDYAGKSVVKAAKHLGMLAQNDWIHKLEEQLNCPISLINDADAACIGIAELGFLQGNRAVGIMPVGTGLGFTVWRNGRRWRPGKMLNLLGSIRTPAGFFDGLASASKLAAEDPENSLVRVLTDPSYQKKREEYLQNLVGIITTAAIIYNLDEVLVCGGLAEASYSGSYPLESILNAVLSEQALEMDKKIRVSVLKEGNALQLIGAVSLAQGEAIARAHRVSKKYKLIATENPYQKDLPLQNFSTADLLQLFWKAEQEAGAELKQSLPLLEKVVDLIYDRVREGGRIIYVGAGTSGRIAAMDAVEIPCTYGFPEDRILSLIAGGIADAALEIESDFEEDASAVPEMLLLNIRANDVVIGITASGTAYYVQSALALAKVRGALSVLIQNDSPDSDLAFCDYAVPLCAGNEVVAGSTRMKSGTATKKMLNFITSSVMIKMGKVEGPYLVDLACINTKLVRRAQEILGILFGLSEEEAFQKLKEADMHLGIAIQRIKRPS